MAEDLQGTDYRIILKCRRCKVRVQVTAGARIEVLEEEIAVSGRTM